MKAGIFNLILGVFCLVGLTASSVFGLTYGDFEYTVTSDTTVTITKYKGGGGSGR